MNRLARAGLVIVGVVGLVVPFFSAAAQESAPRFFPPSGPYAVGRTAYDWVDNTREEIHTSEAGDYRELLVEVWYPAELEPGAVYAPYLDPPMADLFTELYDVPDGRMGQLISNAVADAPLSAVRDAYPVLVFDPGFSVAPRHYSLFLETLASQGYVVFAASHPYVTTLTVYPDGRTVEAVSEGALRAAWGVRAYFDAEFQDMWVPDIEFVLDQIDGLNQDDPQEMFAGRLDTSAFGFIGHSMGARTLTEVCLYDDRCAGVINLDGGYSAAAELIFDKPYMIQLADGGVDTLVTMYRYSLEALGNDFFLIMVPGTHHMSFADMPLWMPEVIDRDQLPFTPDQLALAQIALFGYRDYAVAFFDRYLRGQDVSLLNGPSARHPQVFFLERTEPITSPTLASEPVTASLESGANQGELAIGSADVWLYDGTAGEVLDVMVNADRPAGDTTALQRREYNLLDTLLVIFAPDGSLLATNDDATDTDTNSGIFDLALPADGTYRFEVRSWGNQNAGVYTLLIFSDRETE